MATPFDLASYSPIVNVASATAPAADLRGSAIIGANRELGPLEYDPSLSIGRRWTGQISGTFAVPTEPQVEDGVGFGADGTEFTGELVAGGGGGVPVVGGHVVRRG